MKPDCYYRFRKAPERKTLMFLESFAREYEPLHVAKKRTNQVYTYLTKKPFHILAEQERKPAFSISNDIYKHLSGIFLPELKGAPHLGYGDIKGTQDGLICEFSKNYQVLEIYVIKGQKSIIDKWFWIMVDGELEQELEGIRNEAIEVLEGIPEQTIQQTELLV